MGWNSSASAACRDQHLAQPEQRGVDAAVDENKALEVVPPGEIKIGQV